MTQDNEPDDDTRHGHGRERGDDGRRTLGEISHTHPHTGSAFGDTMTFERGTTVAADGGERDARSSSDDRSFDGGERGPRSADADDGDPDDPADGNRMRDVDHTPRKESEGTNDVYERGHEGREPEEDA
ncbi:MAG: hypothetical protein ABEI11_00135 [Haloarculaceae archaeon]